MNFSRYYYEVPVYERDRFSMAGLRTLYAAGIRPESAPLYDEYGAEDLVDVFSVPDCDTHDLTGVLNYVTDHTEVLYAGNYRWLVREF